MQETDQLHLHGRIILHPTNSRYRVGLLSEIAHCKAWFSTKKIRVKSVQNISVLPTSLQPSSLRQSLSTSRLDLALDVSTVTVFPLGCLPISTRNRVFLTLSRRAGKETLNYGELL